MERDSRPCSDEDPEQRLVQALLWYDKDCQFPWKDRRPRGVALGGAVPEMWTFRGQTGGKNMTDKRDRKGV
jgi:hypothetical protein